MFALQLKDQSNASESEKWLSPSKVYIISVIPYFAYRNSSSLHFRRWSLQESKCFTYSCAFDLFRQSKVSSFWHKSHLKHSTSYSCSCDLISLVIGSSESLSFVFLFQSDSRHMITSVLNHPRTKEECNREHILGMGVSDAVRWILEHGVESFSKSHIWKFLPVSLKRSMSPMMKMRIERSCSHAIESKSKQNEATRRIKLEYVTGYRCLTNHINNASFFLASIFASLLNFCFSFCQWCSTSQKSTVLRGSNRETMTSLLMRSMKRTAVFTLALARPSQA